MLQRRIQKFSKGGAGNVLPLIDECYFVGTV